MAEALTAHSSGRWERSGARTLSAQNVADSNTNLHLHALEARDVRPLSNLAPDPPAPWRHRIGNVVPHPYRPSPDPDPPAMPSLPAAILFDLDGTLMDMYPYNSVSSLVV
jgi:hypothetical protein